MITHTNQGQDFSTILEDVPPKVQFEMAKVVRKELESHPKDGTCTCPIIEALAKLYSYGYRVVKEELIQLEMEGEDGTQTASADSPPGAP